MATVRYTVVNGEVLAEKRNGVRKFYVPDPLGSTVALLDSSQTKTDTYTYWPFGEERSTTGSTPTPFRFVGMYGCYRDSSNRSYVRARHYQSTYGRWLTVDPIGLEAGDVHFYRYVANRPTVGIDPSGEAINVVVGACGVACGGCLVCAIDLALVCSDCGTDGECWGECISGTKENLPPWLRWVCEKACDGCLSCVGRRPRPRPGPGPMCGVRRGGPRYPRPGKRPKYPPRYRRPKPFERQPRYRNCLNALQGCVARTSGYPPGFGNWVSRCRECFDACKGNGMKAWLTDNCRFWEWEPILGIPR